MSHVQGSMAQIQDGAMMPVQSSGAEFNTGKTTAGFSLFEAFAVAAQTDVRIQTISALVADGLTVAEFAQAVTDSIGTAAAMDKLAGFKPADGAKGRDKYGPKQNTMVQRATEMRQIFGYLKLTHADMHAGGYLETLKAARQWLKDAGLTWEGNKAPTKEEKAEKAETAAMAEATKQAMLTIAKQPGESAGEWFARVAVEAERLVAEAEEKATDAAIVKIVEGLLKAHSIENVYNIGLTIMTHAIRAGYVDLDGIATDLRDVTPVEQAPV